jgi:hypothetical protein
MHNNVCLIICKVDVGANLDKVDASTNLDKVDVSMNVNKRTDFEWMRAGTRG